MICRSCSKLSSLVSTSNQNEFLMIMYVWLWVLLRIDRMNLGRWAQRNGYRIRREVDMQKLCGESLSELTVTILPASRTYINCRMSVLDRLLQAQTCLVQVFVCRKWLAVEWCVLPVFIYCRLLKYLKALYSVVLYKGTASFLLFFIPSFLSVLFGVTDKE